MSKKERPREDAKFRVEVGHADLLRAVARVEPICGRRQTVPILSYVELAAGFGTLGVTCNNLDLEMRVEIAATGEGAACLPARRLREMLKAIPSSVERLTLASDGEGNGTVLLTATDIEVSYGALPAPDFPQMTLGNVAWSLMLPDGVFRFLVGGAAPAMSEDEVRYYLNGVCFEVRGGSAVATATDGHRLFSRTLPLAGEIADVEPIIIPRDAVNHLLKPIGAGEVKLTGYRAGNQGRASMAEIVGAGLRARLKLIDGTFPDWRRVVPTADGTVISLATGDLLSALGMAKATASERGRAVKIGAARDGIHLTSHSPDVGTMRARLAGETSAAFPEFGINAEYLSGVVEAIGDLGSKRVNLHVVGAGEPVRVVPDAAIAGVTAVVMPMRV